MDIEKQFEAAFSRITLENGQPLVSFEPEIVHACIVNNDFAKITLILPEDSPLRGSLPAQIEAEIKQIEQIERVAVEVLAAPPQENNPANSAAAKAASQQPKRTAYLQNYEAVIAVASGKGGVGKSTVSVNLALALTQKGYKVSLFDADIYGPSLPIMTGKRGEKPSVAANRLIPIETYGMQTMSIGNLVDENDAVIWRGPMVHQALEQLLRDTNWPGGDFMIIDLPPGTGDIQLSLSQLCELTGAVIVSTPQDVALIDAVKAAQMFSKVEIDILGVVENMSFFACPKCGEETAIFSRNGAEEACKKIQAPFLGAIPIEVDVRIGGDEGKPLMANNLDSAATHAFRTIAKNLVKSLEEG
ncbi:MAG: Mrp/NBP35 family ATP-binding protein [SAR324 cluster bacterium]|nr:Mrp/NBP35 family ATP-binding protein [SAR324 cluster bacterium]MBL7035254.1 Mrp/NBP35 family ATP-binding protein [SAR324 cluster bacterium]